MLDRVVLALVSKAVTLSEAVDCLVDAGFDEEAFGLSRTLVEVAFNLRFVLNHDSERRANDLLTTQRSGSSNFYIVS